MSEPKRRRAKGPKPVVLSRLSEGRSYTVCAPFVDRLGDDVGTNRIGRLGPSFWAAVWTMSEERRRRSIALGRLA